MPLRRLPSNLALAYLAFVLLVWVLGEFVGERTVPTLLLAYAPPLLWLLPAPLVWLWVLVRRRKVGWALLATLLAAWGAGLFHWRAQSAGNLKVLTYNVARGTRTNPDTLALALRQIGADIILLQEANFYDPNFVTRLAADLPEYSLSSAAEVSTLTRLPVIKTQTFDLPQNRREVLVTHLKWQDKPLTIVNAHLGTVMLSPVLQGDLQRVRRTRDARTEQVGVLRSIALQVDGAVLLGGDLNTPPRGVIYRRLRDIFGRDAHDAAGRGPGWTFPSLKLRIDHQFTRDLQPVRATVLPGVGSDHLPLLVEYR
ncbi:MULTISPECIES: endonuclease/exonuclease/phosphatase family protein [Deinococcus]|uniref:endonuclease/exonuclease/phosphatase family protein n=1 Tax=Deinococcus TaxID=1298 RepID=UPI001F109350|nr:MULTISPECIES: endonuclease/exonuclease/phosphatase family protein [Deinococcus]